MNVELSNIISLQQTQSIVEQSIQINELLKLDIVSFDTKLTEIGVEKSRLANEHSLLELQYTIDRDDLLTLETQLNELINEQLRLEGLQKKYIHAQALISDLLEVKKSLYPDGMSSVDFHGKNWYLPDNIGSFDTLNTLMSWDADDFDKWADIFSENEDYHLSQKQDSTFSEYAAGLYQYYITDAYEETSPRENLLVALNSRISQLKKAGQDTTNELNIAIENAAIMQLDFDKKNALLSEKKQKLDELTNMLVNIRALHNQTRLERQEAIYTQKFSEKSLSFQFVQTIHSEWMSFLSAKQLKIDNQNVAATYHYICGDQERLNQFILKQNKLLDESNYLTLLSDWNAFELCKFEGKRQYQALYTLVRFVDVLLSDFQVEKKYYDRLHDEYFFKHKTIMAEKQASTYAQKVIKQQEQDAHKLTLRNYLGDEKSEGDLYRYLGQRNRTYWLFDFFSSMISALTFWICGYRTDKSIRSSFINRELRPALETYQMTGQNNELAHLLCSSSTPFFKPRTREPHSYCLSLDYMLVNIRQELLSKKQVEAYYNNEQLDATVVSPVL